MKRVLLSTLVFLGACGGEEKPPENILLAQGEIQKLTEAFHAAYNKGEADKLGEFLASDCHIKKDDKSFVVGKDECLVFLRQQLEALAGEDLLIDRTTTYGERAIRITGKVATAHYYVVITDKRGAHRGLISATFQYSGGKWLLWQYHDDWSGP